jgi:hypothetical protein
MLATAEEEKRKYGQKDRLHEVKMAKVNCAIGSSPGCMIDQWESSSGRRPEYKMHSGNTRAPVGVPIYTRGLLQMDLYETKAPIKALIPVVK